jgi:hypothetical protein
MSKIGRKEIAAELTLVASLLDEKILSKGVVAAVREIVAEDTSKTLLETIASYADMITWYTKGDGFNPKVIRRYLGDIEDKLKRFEALRQTEAVSKGPVGDAIAAYGDVHDMPTRDLHWKGQYISAAEVAKVIVAAVPGGYNNFDEKRVATAVKRLSSLQWAFAREGSPALYGRGVSTKTDAAKLANGFKRLAADEVGLQMGSEYIKIDKKFPAFIAMDEVLPHGIEFRAWWD